MGPSNSGHTVGTVTGSITGNSFKVQYFGVPGQPTGASVETPGGTNLSATGFYVYEEGITGRE